MLAMVAMAAVVPRKVPRNVMVQRSRKHVVMAVRNVVAPSAAVVPRVAVVPRLRERLLLRHRRKHEFRDFAELLWFTIA